MARSIQPRTLRKELTDGCELALLDVRERGDYARGHLLLAVNLPLSHLELHVRRYAPRRSVRLIVCDGGSDLATRAATVLEKSGYTDVRIVKGGTPACAAAGLELYRGHYAVTYAFALHVENHYRPPKLSAQELQTKRDAGDKLVVLDARPIWDFRDGCIPGALDVPFTELPYRIADVAPDPTTQIVVTCGAVTRGVLGGCSLIEAGLPNPVAVLTDGMRGWDLAGFEPERNATRTAEPTSQRAKDWARAAAQRVRTRFGVRTIDSGQLQRWRDDDARTLFVVDVRTRDEYEAGHLSDAMWVPGCNLIGLYEDHIGTLNARVCLIDDDTMSRAIVTASWLLRLGWSDVAVLEGGVAGQALVSGPEKHEIVELDAASVILTIDAPSLSEAIGDSGTLVIDVASSATYVSGHIPGAWWTIRANLSALRAKLPAADRYVLTSEDGHLAALAAKDLQALITAPVAVLDGGTAAWHDAGYCLVSGMTRTLGEIDDSLAEMSIRPNDDRATVLAVQQRYLSWQAGLLEQIERDATFSFPPLTAA